MGYTWEVRRAPVSQARAGARAHLRHAHGAPRRDRGAWRAADADAPCSARRWRAAALPGAPARRLPALHARPGHLAGRVLDAGGGPGLARLPALGLARSRSARWRRPRSFPSRSCRPFAGVVADRVSRHRLIMVTQIGGDAARRRSRPPRGARTGRPSRWSASSALRSVSSGPSTCRHGRRSWSRWSDRATSPSAIALNASIFNAARVVGPGDRGSSGGDGRRGAVLLPERGELSRRPVGPGDDALPAGRRPPGPARPAGPRLGEGLRYVQRDVPSLRRC